MPIHADFTLDLLHDSISGASAERENVERFTLLLRYSNPHVFLYTLRFCVTRA
jgi:hypothetical protein